MSALTDMEREALPVGLPVDQCEHPSAKVEFDAAASRGLSSSEVRRRWPRFMGRCADCAGQVIKYASWEHYIAGDW